MSSGVGETVWSSGHRKPNNAFEWVALGQDLTFTMWERGEPNNQHGDEYCLAITLDFDWGGMSWNDEGCYETFYSICEY